MRAGVLHSGEEQDAHHQLTPGETGQGGYFVLRRKGEAQHHEEDVEQAHPADVIERLEGQTAAVIIGVAACVVVARMWDTIGQSRMTIATTDARPKRTRFLIRTRAAAFSPPFANRTQPAMSSSA